MRGIWKFLSYGFFLAAGLSATSAYGGDGPRPQDHEFNQNMPTSLKGENIELRTADGKPFGAYVAGPQDAKKGILVIHEWWGLNDHIRAWTDRFAELGYRAVAVDLYNGQVTSDAARAGELMKAVSQPEADAKLKAGLAHLQQSGRKLATIGWCFGGGQSLRASLLMPEAVSATVIYYGEPVLDVDQLKKLQGPVLGIFANRDEWITPAKVDAFEKAMKTAGKTLVVRRYDADHAFANPSGQRYDEAAAKDAWEVTRSFLADALR